MAQNKWTEPSCNKILPRWVFLQVECNSEWDGLRIAIDTSATEPWVKNLSYTWDWGFIGFLPTIPHRNPAYVQLRICVFAFSFKMMFLPITPRLLFKWDLMFHDTWEICCVFCFCGVTFPETNILDLEKLPFQKEISIPTIHVGFRECVCLASLCFDDHLKSGWRFDSTWVTIGFVWTTCFLFFFEVTAIPGIYLKNKLLPTPKEKLWGKKTHGSSTSHLKSSRWWSRICFWWR